MNLFKRKTVFDDTSDASLVAACLSGNRDAFGRIVERYQRLLCSLAYSSVGDLAASEDVAQEAFVEAWKKLGSLQEPEKLKSWLCGIARFKASHYLRSESRRPVRGAADLDDVTELESGDARSEEVTMKKEEQALLWQTLEKVPETYREPLVLYYREHRSVEHVAYELDLSEDAVKQRLSRGRKMLQERMMGFVEDALAKSAPSSVFTMGVLTAIAAATPPTKAATAGAAAVQVGSWFKWASVAAFMASISGLVSSFFALRASLDQARTDRERKEAVFVSALYLGMAAVFVCGLFLFRHLAVASYEHSGYYMFATQVLMAGFAAGYMWLTFRIMKEAGRRRAEERARRPDLFTAAIDQPGSKKREYRSRATLLGIPLVHVKFAASEEGEKPAVGWIAGGEKAYGILFAWGLYAVGTVSVGVVSVGVITVGAVGIGGIGLGTLGIGFLAMGATAIGYKAYASMASTGWESAFSYGFSLGVEGAVGPIAYAEQINNEAAGELANIATVGDVYAYVLAAMALMVIAPVVFYSKEVRRRFREK
ncbi:MAG: sigma-70 family RNA polymerase sigma factor [Verrucomicrobiota bacterium]